MTPFRQSCAKHRVDECLKMLRLRALNGPKSKPTVKELNAIMANLEAVSALLSENFIRAA